MGGVLANVPRYAVPVQAVAGIGHRRAMRQLHRQHVGLACVGRVQRLLRRIGFQHTNGIDVAELEAVVIVRRQGHARRPRGIDPVRDHLTGGEPCQRYLAKSVGTLGLGHIAVRHGLAARARHILYARAPRLGRSKGDRYRAVRLRHSLYVGDLHAGVQQRFARRNHGAVNLAAVGRYHVRAGQPGHAPQIDGTVIVGLVGVVLSVDPQGHVLIHHGIAAGIPKHQLRIAAGNFRHHLHIAREADAVQVCLPLQQQSAALAVQRQLRAVRQGDGLTRTGKRVVARQVHGQLFALRKL